MAHYNIKEVSEMFQLPASTLRYYEEQKLLTNIPRNEAGQRIYEDCHIHRLKTICCFKHAGMTISQLQEFFSYENAEEENIDSILQLLHSHKDNITDQIRQLQDSYVHLQKKLHFYEDVKKSLNAQKPLPQWKDYKFKTFTDEL